MLRHSQEDSFSLQVIIIPTIYFITSYHHHQQPPKITNYGTEFIPDLYQTVQDISRMLTLFREWYIKTNTEWTLYFIYYLLQLFFVFILHVGLIVAVAAAVWHLSIKDYDDDDDDDIHVINIVYCVLHVMFDVQHVKAPCSLPHWTLRTLFWHSFTF